MIENLFCVFCGKSHGGDIFFIAVRSCHRGYITPNVV